MLEFLKKSLGLNEVAKTKQKVEKKSISCETVVNLMHYFPIGTRLRYYPEYQKDIMMNTLLVAYWINGDLIYSTKGVSFNNNVLVLNDRGTHRSYQIIDSFRFVVPVLEDQESKLDYAKREELAKVGGMTRGNTITLMAEKHDGQIPVLDTIVNKRAILKDGLYANQQVALLDIDFDSLSITDQRAHLRLQTNVPVSLQVADNGQMRLLNGRMKDFSDCSLRVDVEHDLIVDSRPKEGEEVIVSFHLPNCPEMISLAVKVYRVMGDSIVMMFSGRVENGRMRPLSQIDILNVKANLLQHCAADVVSDD